jgi:hypothetical protein
MIYRVTLHEGDEWSNASIPNDILVHLLLNKGVYQDVKLAALVLPVGDIQNQSEVVVDFILARMNSLPVFRETPPSLPTSHHSFAGMRLYNDVENLKLLQETKQQLLK